MSIEELAAALSTLKERRAEYAGAKAEHDAALERWKNSAAGTIYRYQEAGQAMQDADKAVRELAVAEFNRTHEPKPLPGIEIKRFEVMEYDPARASMWARDHQLWFLLKLDAQAFEKMAKVSTAPGAMPFVEIKDDWRPQIASSLP